MRAGNQGADMEKSEVIPTTNEIQARLVGALDEMCPIDVRRQAECRQERTEQAARLAVRECVQANIDQSAALGILLRLWRER